MNCKKRFLISFIFSICLFSEAYCQSCTEVLNSARENFNAGRLYGIPALLKPCLDNGFSKDQKIQAYWLLARTYLLIDDPISAEDSYLKLLKHDPKYTIDEENDPVDMVYLSKKFETTPIFLLHARIGVNSSFIGVINNFGIDNTFESKENYTSKVGVVIVAGMEYNLSEHLSLGVEATFMSRNYAYDNVLFSSDELTFEESQTGFSIPFYLKYKWNYQKVRPYVYAGLGLNYLLKSYARVKRIDKVNTDEDLTEQPVTGPEIDITKLRNRFARFAHVGIGADYRLGYNYLVFDIRYELGLSNITNESEQYSQDPLLKPLLYKFGYVDDDKRMNNIYLSIGFVKPLYKSRKIKRKSSGNFIFNLFK